MAKLTGADAGHAGAVSGRKNFLQVHFSGPASATRCRSIRDRA